MPGLITVSGPARGSHRDVLDADPAACGYADQCWTLARIAEQVWRRFGVEYTLAGMDVLLHRLGWSVQVPARRAADAGTSGARASPRRTTPGSWTPPTSS